MITAHKSSDDGTALFVHYRDYALIACVNGQAYQVAKLEGLQFTDLGNSPTFRP